MDGREVMDKDQTIEFLQNERKERLKHNGELHQFVTRLCNINHKIKEIRHLQSLDGYEDECPQHVKDDYNKSINDYQLEIETILNEGKYG